MGCPLASLTIPCSTELAADALATKSMTPIKPIQIGLINITRKREATWQRHTIHSASFDLTSLRVTWFRSATLLRSPLTAASHLEKAFVGCEGRLVKTNGGILRRAASSGASGR